MINVTSLEHTDSLAPYAQELLDGLIPILERLDITQLSSKSYIAVENQKGGFVLRLEIIPGTEEIPLLDLWAGPDQCILGYADSEQIEAHGIPFDWKTLVSHVIVETERYLNGVTVIENYNRNRKLIKKAYFYGVDTENNRDSIIGSSQYLTFPRKVESVVKRTHRFLK